MKKSQLLLWACLAHMGGSWVVNSRSMSTRVIPAARAAGDDVAAGEDAAAAAAAQAAKFDKALNAMTKFSNKYAKATGTYYSAEPTVTAVVIRGLAEHKATLGAPLCPCRHYDDKRAEVKRAYWNCPCVPMQREKKCHCMLFLPDGSDFAGSSQETTVDEVRRLSSVLADEDDDDSGIMSFS